MARDSHRRFALAAGAVILGLLAACTPSSSPDVPAATAPTVQQPSITPPPASPSPEAEAAQAVEQAVTNYYAGTDNLLSDPLLPIDQATDVATGPELDEMRQLVQQRRIDGRRQTGQAVVASLEVKALNLAPPATAKAQVCLDVADVDVLDADGASVVLPGRQSRSVIDLDLVEQDATGWVVERTASEGVPCDAP